MSQTAGAEIGGDRETIAEMGLDPRGRGGAAPEIGEGDGAVGGVRAAQDLQQRLGAYQGGGAQGGAQAARGLDEDGARVASAGERRLGARAGPEQLEAIVELSRPLGATPRTREPGELGRARGTRPLEGGLRHRGPRRDCEAGQTSAYHPPNSGDDSEGSPARQAQRGA